MAWAARSFARMVFPTLARAGWSYSKMLKYAKNKGWTYAPKVMASDIREMRNSAQFGRQVMSLGDEDIIPKGIMSPTKLRLPRKYRVFGQSGFRNVNTGKLKYVTQSFYTNTLSSKQAYAMNFLSEKGGGYAKELWQLETFNVLEVQHNIGYPY